MTGLIFTGEERELAKLGAVKTLYDPACGTGGMLTVGKDYIQNNFNKDATVYLFGQELNSATYAICKADMLLKGENIEHIKGGDKEHDKASTLSNDQHHDKKFDHIISNPPYGVEWKKTKMPWKMKRAVVLRADLVQDFRAFQTDNYFSFSMLFPNSNHCLKVEVTPQLFSTAHHFLPGMLAEAKAKFAVGFLRMIILTLLSRFPKGSSSIQVFLPIYGFYLIVNQ